MFNGKMKSSLAGYVTGVGRAVGNLKRAKPMGAAATAYITPPGGSQNREGSGTVRKSAPVTGKTSTRLPVARGRTPKASRKSFGTLGGGT